MTLLSGWNRSSRSAKKNIKPRTLQCEGLEDRRVLATMVGTEADFIAALGAADPCIELTANITLSGTPLVIAADVAIDGAGFTVDGAGMSRVFDIDDGLGYVNSNTVSMDNITISGGGGVAYGGGIFNNSGILTITNSSITGNSAIDPGMNYTGNGGGILTNSDLTMSNTSVTGNVASSLVDLPTTGGGFYVTGIGGGIDTGAYAALTLTDVNVDGNEASNIGGGINIDSPGPHLITGGSFNNNVVGNAGSQVTAGLNVFGGGFSADSAGIDLTIIGSDISGNTGGGTAAAGDNTFDYGIGIDLTTRGVTDTITLEGVTISNNIQTSDGVSAGALSIQRGSGAALTAVEGGTFNVVNSTISGNQSSDLGDFPGYGGGISFGTFDTGAGIAYSGIFNVTDTDITGNTGIRGGGWGTRYNGGYANDGVGARSIINITGGSVSGNTSTGNGGGANWSWVATDTVLDGVTLDGNVATTDDSGAIGHFKAFTANGIYATSDIEIRNSTISNNSAAGNGGALNVTTGGLTYAAQENTVARIVNSTISGNTAALGGGVYAYDADFLFEQSTASGNYAAGTGGFQVLRTYFGYVGTPMQAEFTLDRSTVAYNNALGSGGGIYADYYSDQVITNSVISGNTSGGAGTDLYAADPGADATFTVNYSLLSSSAGANVTAGTGNLLDVSGDLGALADNGGPTFTHLPNATSMAIDNGGATVGTTDQRGYGPRDVGGTMDIGSVEVGAMPVAVDGDFNDDGLWDCLDVDALSAESAAGTNDAAFDLTGDGSVNFDDITAWLAEAGGINLMSGNSYAVGDATLDGVVDGLDFIEWNDNKFTTSTAWCGGNFNGDGVTDGLDFIDWNDNKFTQQGPITQPGNSGTVETVHGGQVAQLRSAKAAPQEEMGAAHVKTSHDGHNFRLAGVHARPRAEVSQGTFAATPAMSEAAGEVSTPVIEQGADRVASDSALVSHQVDDASTEVRRSSASVSAIDAIFADLG